jgi:N-acyl-D-aspartate/D-glutamate deacylase
MSTTNAAKEAEFDLVIRGGRIVDGTRMPAYYGDLAVKAGVIVEIGSVRGKGR